MKFVFGMAVGGLILTSSFIAGMVVGYEFAALRVTDEIITCKNEKAKEE